MKKIIASVTLLLALLLNLGSPALAADPVGGGSLFMLVLYSEEEESGVGVTAFYVEDGEGRRCLVTSPLVAQFQDSGYDDMVMLLRDDFSAAATLLGTEGDCAFYTAEGVEDFEPMKLAAESDMEKVVLASMVSEDLEHFKIHTDSVDLTAWEWNGSCYTLPGEEVRLELLGGVFADEATGEVVGMGTYTGDVELSMLPLTGVRFPAEMAVDQVEAARPPQGETDPDPGNWLDKNGIWLGLAIAAAAVVYGMKKGKKPGKRGEENIPAARGEAEDAAAQEKTVYIPEEPRPQQPETPTQACGGWQLRGTRGILYGQVFLLRGDTTIGRGNPMEGDTISFPENTQGISARHCKLALQGERVVLRDLGSTYGTVLNGSRIEASIEYHLSEGDVIDLPGQQSLRLEKAGSCVQELTPAVQSVSGVTYRADIHGRLAFGRNPGAQVHFRTDDTTISMNHCVLYREGGRLYLMDTSSNGTFFRGDSRLRPNIPYPVKRGDTFFLASPKYSFVISEE